MQWLFYIEMSLFVISLFVHNTLLVRTVLWRRLARRPPNMGRGARGAGAEEGADRLDHQRPNVHISLPWFMIFPVCID